MSLTSNRRVLPHSYYTKNYTNSRRARAILISCCARKHDSFAKMPPDDQNRIIRKMERSCYNAACLHFDIFDRAYNTITYKIQTNLLNPRMIEKIISGEIDPDQVGFMSARELCPGRSSVERKIIEQRREQKIVKKYSSQHECGRCGGRKTTEQEVQLRSLDEGSTLIITCEMENCTNVWRITS